MGYFRFLFTVRTFFGPVPYKLKKNIFVAKNPLNYFLLKVTKFHGDSVQNLQGGAKRPPPACLGLKWGEGLHETTCIMINLYLITYLILNIFKL